MTNTSTSLLNTPWNKKPKEQQQQQKQQNNKNSCSLHQGCQILCTNMIFLGGGYFNKNMG